ncbi:MAG: hypothetical protein OHK0046_03460 [Anaerolineae bacterium]
MLGRFKAKTDAERFAEVTESYSGEEYAKYKNENLVQDKEVKNRWSFSMGTDGEVDFVASSPSVPAKRKRSQVPVSTSNLEFNFNGSTRKRLLYTFGIGIAGLFIVFLMFVGLLFANRIVNTYYHQLYSDMTFIISLIGVFLIPTLLLLVNAFAPKIVRNLLWFPIFGVGMVGLCLSIVVGVFFLVASFFKSLDTMRIVLVSLTWLLTSFFIVKIGIEMEF